MTTRVSLLKSAADVVKRTDEDYATMCDSNYDDNRGQAQCTDVDYATGSFCSSCSIPPLTAGGFWSPGNGCAMCDYDCNVNRGG